MQPLLLHSLHGAELHGAALLQHVPLITHMAQLLRAQVEPSSLAHRTQHSEGVTPGVTPPG